MFDGGVWDTVLRTRQSLRVAWCTAHASSIDCVLRRCRTLLSDANPDTGVYLTEDVRCCWPCFTPACACRTVRNDHFARHPQGSSLEMVSSTTAGEFLRGRSSGDLACAHRCPSSGGHSGKQSPSGIHRCPQI